MHDAQYALHAELEDRHWWFAGRRTIVKRLLLRVVPPYAHGASLIAILRRRADAIAPRAKPLGLPPDAWNPTQAR